MDSPCLANHCLHNLEYFRAAHMLCCSCWRRFVVDLSACHDIEPLLSFQVHSFKRWKGFVTLLLTAEAQQ